MGTKWLMGMVQAKNLDALAAFVRDRRLDYVQPGMLSRFVSKNHHVTCKTEGSRHCDVQDGRESTLQLWQELVGCQGR